MHASHAGRRLLAAVGIALVTIGWTGGASGAAELPPVDVPDLTIPTVPAITLPSSPLVPVPVDPSPTVPTTAPAPSMPPTAGTPTGARTATSTPTDTPDPTIPTADVPDGKVEVVASPPLRAVASQRARQFAFPFALALGVVGFLALQHRIGTNDPRLAAAPVDDDRRTFS